MPWGQSIVSQAQNVRSKGRFGDSILAHISPKEAQLLKAMGGSGTTNPETGLPEFFSMGGDSDFGSDVGGFGNTDNSNAFGGSDSNDGGGDYGYTIGHNPASAPGQPGYAAFGSRPNGAMTAAEAVAAGYDKADDDYDYSGMEQSMADNYDKADEELIPGLGLTPTSGWFGFREKPVYDPTTGMYKTEVGFGGMNSLVGDLTGMALNNATGGLGGLLLGRAASRLIEASGNPGYSNKNALRDAFYVSGLEKGAQNVAGWFGDENAPNNLAKEGIQPVGSAPATQVASIERQNFWGNQLDDNEDQQAVVFSPKDTSAQQSVQPPSDVQPADAPPNPNRQPLSVDANYLVGVGDRETGSVNWRDAGPFTRNLSNRRSRWGDMIRV